MKLLNSKTVINCIDSELENHTKESEEILKKLLLYNDYDCAVFLNILIQFIKIKSQS